MMLLVILQVQANYVNDSLSPITVLDHSQIFALPRQILHLP